MSLGGIIGSGITSGGASGAVSSGYDALNAGQNVSGIANYANTGYNALTSLTSGLTGPNASTIGSTNPFSSNTIGQSFQASPGYQYALSQAQAATNNSAAAKGGLLSGQQQLANANVASQLANQNYYQYVGANQQGLGQYANALQGISGLGENAASNIFGGYAGLGQADVSALTNAAVQEGNQASSGANGILGFFGL